MDCPSCGFSNPSGVPRCQKCGSPFAAENVEAGAAAAERSAATLINPSADELRLKVGSILTGRYEILQSLGRGGVGEVFKARDRQLDRLVAVKVIHPQLAEDPGFLRRLKRELLAARKVGHNNIGRIFDLGQADGIKFIMMEHIQGEDLKRVLAQRKKIVPDEACSILEQVCQALAAAHSKGVIHGNLKPQNIVLDAQGRAVVIDLGIAPALEAPPGAHEYSPPEQARGGKIDARADLFSLGVILYELLTGTLPCRPDSAAGDRPKHVQSRTTPPADLDGSIPRWLSDIAIKCLAGNRKQRYQSAREILLELENRKKPEIAPSQTAALPAAEPGSRRVKWLVAAGAVLVLALVLFLLLKNRFAPAPRVAREPVTVLVADFANTTSDSMFDGALESTLTLAVETDPFIVSYGRGDARRLAAQLQPGSVRLDESLARQVAVREGIRVVLAGSIASRAEGYLLSVRVVDAAGGNLLAAREVEAKSRDVVVASIGKAAVSIRKALDDQTPESAQSSALQALTAEPIEAIHQCASAQELEWAGKTEEAISAYLKAIQSDAKTARAHAALAMIYEGMGRREEAETYYRQAIALTDRLPEREKLRILGRYYLFMRDSAKAIEVLSEMVGKYPSDSNAFSALASAYWHRRSLGEAFEAGRKAVEIYPKNLQKRQQVAIYAMYASSFASAVSEARAVLEANPADLEARLVMALSELAQGRTERSAEEYGALEKLGPSGASLAAAGMADLAMYEGRAADAAAILEKHASLDLEAKNLDAAARKLVVLASAKLQIGQTAQALAAAERAEKLSQAPVFLCDLGRFWVESGQELKARTLATALSAQASAEPQAYGRLVEGELQLRRGNPKEAADQFLGAQKLVDSWLGRFDLARADLEAGAFNQARAGLELCLRRRGEAAALFFDQAPTYRLYPAVHYFLGRAQDGLKSPEAAESYRSFLEIKRSAVNDPLAVDAQQRLSTLRVR